ncbi:MAG: CheR family methyltransferase [Pseudomonadota bacterium]
MIPLEASCSAQVLEVLVHKAHQHLGADFSGARGADLLRRLRLLAVEQEIEAFGPWLEQLAFAEWTEAQVQALTSAFTVGETYFCRDAEAFAWLSQHHLVPLIARRRLAGQRYLRCWSAACCTGEEAYSLLFMLDALLGAESQAWTLEIVASDINAEFLARAERGRYGQNAFRRNEEAFRTRYFQAVGRAWHVRPRWRGRIRFIQHNLANAPLPDRTLGLVELDLILCRNVLMYFSAERAADTLRRLLACLTAEGLLLLSAVEAGLATQAGLTGFWAGSNYALGAGAHRAPCALVPPPLPIGTPAAAGARRLAAMPLQPPADNPVHRPMGLTQALPRPCEQHWQLAGQAQRQGHPHEARQHLQDYLACPGLSLAQQHQASLSMARSWADQQHNTQAQDWLQRALALDAGSATAYWLLAVLTQQEGDGKGALQALQKALYLDPDLILAHFLQAQLLRDRGQVQACRKALSICCRLLEQHPKDRPVPLGEGLSGGQLQALCEQLMESLPA